MNQNPIIEYNVTSPPETVDQWLGNVTAWLNNAGFTKYKQNLKHEDYTYWKTVWDNYHEKKLYSIGLLFYDWRKYPTAGDRIGIMYECMLLGENRIDMTVSDDIMLKDFEQMCEDFYNSMKKYVK